MYAPNYLVFPAGQPERFQWTRKARQELGPRFARQGFMLDNLTTLEAIDDAIAAVVLAEFHALTPEQRADRHCLNHVFDLQLVTDPLWGVPPQPLEARREERRRVMYETVRPYLPPPPAAPPETGSAILRRMWVEGWTRLRALA
ncbi:MAG TPA: hypothetical protein PKX00_25430, partial [Opitutaceae bacterium]|nr:hypothetical protein [Opitutaceae bacterium]